MMRRVRGQKIDTVFVLIIFCVFAISVLMVLMLGASIYQNVNDLTQEGHNERLVLSYIWTKVKNDDEAGRISVGSFHGYAALFFDEEFDGITYRTMIYHYDGWVYELFSEKDLGFYPEDGKQILRIGELGFEELDNGMLRISSGDAYLLISLRGGALGELEYEFSDEGVFIG